QVEEKAPEIDSADLVVAILTDLDATSVGKMCESLEGLAGPLKIAVLQNDHRDIPLSGAPALAESTLTSSKASVFHIPWPLAKPDVSSTAAVSMFPTYQSVFAAVDSLQARCCCIMASKLENMTPECVCQFALPLLQGEVDLVLPHYARRKSDGMLNKSILAP